MSEGTLYTALLAAQKAMGPVVKNATNPHLKSKYADLGAVLDTIEQPLWDNGLLIAQRFTHDQGGAILVTELIHAASGETLTSAVPVVSKDPTDPQKIGAAITYYRRYSLLALLGLAPEDDDGHAASQPPRQNTANPPPAFVNRPRETPAAVPPAATAHIEKDLLEAIHDGARDPDARWDALWDYYDRAGDVADLNRRAERVKVSGIPERDLRAAYKQKHSALAQLLGLAGGAQIA
jgi:hypothetical protein